MFLIVSQLANEPALKVHFRVCFLGPLWHQPIELPGKKILSRDLHAGNYWLSAFEVKTFVGVKEVGLGNEKN